MKVLLLDPSIPDYRLHIFNLIGNKVDLTIAHNGKIRTKENLKFKQLQIPQKKLGPFSYYPINLHKLCNNYDIVISDANIRYIDRNFLILNPYRKYKWITWGIGVSASYNKEFDEDKRLDFIRHFIFKMANAQIFYSDYPINKYIKAGFDPKSLFVANNTTYVDFNENKEFKKFKLLFVGTLYKQKRIYELLDAYLKYSRYSSSVSPLEIIGDGTEYRNIKIWIEANGLQNNITLHGSIFDHNMLEKHFRESYACISPGQAGLSVLTSMGYGTPYITKKDAITGGEIFNIKNNKNGVLYSNSNDLADILKDIEQDSIKYIKMGENAREYYKLYRQPKQMIQAFIDACNYVLNNNK